MVEIKNLLENVYKAFPGPILLLTGPGNLVNLIYYALQRWRFVRLLSQRAYKAFCLFILQRLCVARQDPAATNHHLAQICLCWHPIFWATCG